MLLAAFGLFISSFSLLVLQSTMGGLQHKLVKRSKRVMGNAILYLDNEDMKFARKVNGFLEKNSIKSVMEYEIELLLRNEKYPSPVVVHGIDENGPIPEFLKGVYLTDLVIGGDLAIKINLVDQGEKVRLISPSHVDSFMGDIPRTTSLFVDNIITTDVPEIDSFHTWTSLSVIQNLIRKIAVNRIRIYGEVDFKKLKSSLYTLFGNGIEFKTWEEENNTLVWALRLETTVMVFLFVAMTGLVSLCITSGFMIFFGKIKNDMASLWIMGASKKRLERVAMLFINLLSAFTVLAGLFAGLVFLYLFDHYGIDVMPDIFIDRKIPVHITMKGIFISAAIPYAISIFFSMFSLNQFKRQVDYLKHVRTIG
ncbi:MAG: ABC transporter permease [Bacteriovoracaceae bacterium]|nr:ABC transporter permease [Bacteriovoracaceae bacterium]